jgi:hypothetical protein
MIIITQVEFPPDSAKEMGKCFTKLPSLPPYLTMSGPYIRASEGKGIKVINLYICDNAHISEALLVVNSRLTAYFGVPGFTYSCDAWLEAAEGFKMVGIG